MRIITLLTAVTLFAGGLPLAAQDALTERQLVEYLDAQASGARALLERVVNINSGTMNFSGVREVGGVFRAELDALGFATEWIDGAAFERAGHLVAHRRGSGPRLLLIGHLDTVFELDSPFQRFQATDASTALGPGVVDMKGGDVVIVYALKALQAAGALDGMNVTVVMTGDEERSGRPLDRARKVLVEAAEWADIAIGFENGDSDPRTAVIARRGSTGWQLRVTGRAAHSSQIFRDNVGVGAIYEASRILYRFFEDLSGERFLTFNPGVMVAGTEVEYDDSQSRGGAFGKSNVVAEHAVVSGDIRTISAEQLAHAKERMQRIAAHNLPLTSADLTFNDSYPPLAPTEGNRQLLALFDRVSRDLGFGPVTAVDPRSAGAADISFTAGLVEMAIDGLGPGGGDDHTVNERIDLPTLTLQAKRAAVLLYRLSRRPETE